MKNSFIFNEKFDIRLDNFVTQKLNCSKNYSQKLITSSLVLVNNKVSKKSYLLKINDYIEINASTETKRPIIEPYNLNLEIVYEDEFLAVINKPKNLIVHPADSFQGVTLVNGLLFQFDVLKQIDSIRPGIVHRLDKDTTGLMLIAKNESVRLKLQILMKQKEIKRFYWAIIHGHIPSSGEIMLPIGRHRYNRLKKDVVFNGKTAITYFSLLKYFKDFSLIECQLGTGRTHQIRVHLSYIKHPILGDLLYNSQPNNIPVGQFLHAKKLEFIHPIKQSKVCLEIDLPLTFRQMLHKLCLK